MNAIGNKNFLCVEPADAYCEARMIRCGFETRDAGRPDIEPLIAKVVATKQELSYDSAGVGELRNRANKNSRQDISRYFSIIHGGQCRV
jgi:hypothetical protein